MFSHRNQCARMQPERCGSLIILRMMRTLTILTPPPAEEGSLPKEQEQKNHDAKMYKGQSVVAKPVVVIMKPPEILRMEEEPMLSYTFPKNRCGQSRLHADDNIGLKSNLAGVGNASLKARID